MLPNVVDVRLVMKQDWYHTLYPTYDGEFGFITCVIALPGYKKMYK